MTHILQSFCTTILTCLVFILYFTSIANFAIGNQKNNNIIYIGFAGPIDGLYSRIGIAMKNSINHLIKKINDSGGLLDKKLELIAINDDCSAGGAKQAAKQFVIMNVNFVIGHVCSEASLAAMPIYKENNILMITPSATDNAITNSNYDNVLRVTGTNSSQIYDGYRYIIRNANWQDKSIAVISQNNVYANNLADELKNKFTKDMIKNINYWTIKDIKTSNIIEKIKFYKTKVIYFTGYSDGFSDLLKAIIDAGLYNEEMYFITTDAVIDMIANKDLVKKLKYNNIAITMAIKDFNTPKMQKMLQELKIYDNKDQDIWYFAAQGYSAMQVLETGIRKAKYLKTKLIINTIKSIDKIDTIIGSLGFNYQGDIKRLKYNIYNLINGEIKKAK